MDTAQQWLSHTREQPGALISPHSDTSTVCWGQPGLPVLLETDLSSPAPTKELSLWGRENSWRFDPSSGSLGR